MDAVVFFKQEFQRIQNTFNNAQIKLGYSKCGESYIVQVNPLSVFEDDNYIDIEISISSSFSEKFPEEDLFFVSEESLNQVEDSIYCLESKTRIKHVVDFNWFSHSFEKEYDNLINTENNIFASAA